MILVAWGLHIQDNNKKNKKKKKKEGFYFSSASLAKLDGHFFSVILGIVITRVAGKTGEARYRKVQSHETWNTLIVHRFELFLCIWSSSASQISHQSISSQLNLSERQPTTRIRKIWTNIRSYLFSTCICYLFERKLQEAHAHRPILSVWFTPPSISKTRYC